jgi:ribose 5-phosphate isomerase B
MRMRVGIAADHGGFELKERLSESLKEAGHSVVDFGAFRLDETDDYPDFVIPMARSLAEGKVDRGIAVCGSGVGACIAANKVAGVRAALITDGFSAHQGVEDDDMNLMCIGGGVVGNALARDLVRVFLSARFKNEERFNRRLQKVAHLEKKGDF